MPGPRSAGGEAIKIPDQPGTPPAGVSGSRTLGVRLLAILCILVGVGIFIYPFYSRIRYAIVRPAPVYPYATRLVNTAFPVTASEEHLPDTPRRLPTENRLVIPKIGVNIQIVEGTNENALFRGSWRLPETSTPEKGGNTVLTVHRFQYLAGPNTLALADKLVVGDEVLVYWRLTTGEMAEYDYRIFRTRIVNPDQTDILDNTDTPKLTIFTCTPIFSTKQRLVIEAEPLTS